VKPIAVDEILNIHEYEKVREERRRRVIALKSIRRVTVGRYLSFLFENRETVWFQIQEMCRTERIVDEAKIAEEVDVYNTLLPPPGALAATMMIEITESAQIQAVLDGLQGIDTGAHVHLEVGPHRVPGLFEAGHSDEERGKISAVHFVSFPLPPAARRIFRQAEVALVVEHPYERARAVLTPATQTSLADDLEEARGGA
jgi:Protein of unknown function (DUF3501)